MSGRHEPPTKRSFYLSLATSTIRFAIIVALVVGGVVVISKAFPGGEGSLPEGGPPITTSPTPTATPTKTPKPPPSAQVEGVHLGVFNGTTVDLLAASTATKLEEKYGYVVDQVGDAPAPVETTTLYFRSPKDRVEAQYLADHFFKDLDVKVAKLPAGTDVEPSAQVAVYLGNDYATTQQ